MRPHNFEDILAKIQGAKQSGEEWTAPCPLPGHKTPAGHLTLRNVGDKALVKCQRGRHSYKEYCELWGFSSLAYSNNGNGPNGSVITDTYDYTDADGKLLYQVVRYDPKDFKQRRPDGKGDWIWNLNGIKPVLYHLPDVIRAIAEGHTIYIVEGEKDADNLIKLKLASTTNSGGAEKWKPEYSVIMTDASVVLIPDNDAAGQRHAAKVADSLHGKTKSIKIVELPDKDGYHVKDVSDWLAAGGTVAELEILASTALEYKPTEKVTQEELIEGDLVDFNAGVTFEQLERMLSEAPELKPEATLPIVAAGNRQPLPRSYIITDSKGKQALDIEALINDLLADFHFATLRDNGEVLIYRDGHYQPQGKCFIKSECQLRVGVSALLTEHKINEIIGHIIRSTYVDRKTFNADKFTLNLTNGLLNTCTRKLRSHTPDYLSSIRIPVTYDENADCPAIRKFLSDVHHCKDIPVVEEIAGYCLTPDISIQKAVLIVGGGDQGKSTELSLFKAFIGADNCSNVPWHALELNRFAKSALEGKLVNIFADLPSQSLSMVSAFKMLTGGDTIGTEKKFGDYYSFVNYAKLIFSANKPPKVQGEDSYAFWRRWIILDFPNQIPEDKKDVNILYKLTTPAELSGFLNIALDGLSRLRAAGRFSYDKSVEATTEYYLKAADPVYAFLQDCVEVSPQDWVTKDDLYNAFEAYCVTKRLPVSKPNSFARSLKNQTEYRIRSIRPEVDGKRPPAWQGIKISVRDVKDVKVFPLPKGHAQGDNTLQMGIKIEKNAGNLDAAASITHEHQNPDADDLPGDDHPEAVLGMTVDQALEIWRAEGAPIIHLGPGDNCEDLAELLSYPCDERQLEVIKTWLQKKIHG